MATTYSLTSASYDGRQLKLTCTQTKNIDKNTSTIKWVLSSEGGNSNYYTTGATTVKINGVQVYYKARTAWNTEAFPAAKGSVSGTLTVAHNSDGAKSISCSLSTAIYTSTITTKSGTWTLDSNPRASSIYCKGGYIGNKVSIAITRASSNFTHTLKYTFGSLAGTIATKTASTSVEFAIPTTFYAQIPNAKSGKCILTCETYSGGTKIGTSTAEFSAMCDEALCKPTLSPSASIPADSITASLTGSTAKYIRQYSYIDVATGAAARNSATIKSQSIKCGGQVVNGASGQIKKVESGTFTFTVTDSRGFTTTQTLERNIVPYIPPTIECESQRPTTSGELTFTISGNFFNGSFGAKSNVLDVIYNIKVNGEEWGTAIKATPTFEGNTYSATITLTGLDYKNAYVLSASVKDSVYTNWLSITPIVLRTLPVFDWGSDDFNFNVPVSIMGGAVDCIVEQGESGIWSYRKWASGHVEMFGKYVVSNVAISTAFANMFRCASVLTVGEYPFTIINSHCVATYETTNNNGAFLWTTNYSTTTAAPNFYLVRPSSITGTTGRIVLHVVGRWK